jgi:predicted alpha/beta-hydrolase family hydrolase
MTWDPHLEEHHAKNGRYQLSMTQSNSDDCVQLGALLVLVVPPSHNPGSPERDRTQTLPLLSQQNLCEKISWEEARPV